MKYHKLIVYRQTVNERKNTFEIVPKIFDCSYLVHLIIFNLFFHPIIPEHFLFQDE